MLCYADHHSNAKILFACPAMRIFLVLAFFLSFLCFFMEGGEAVLCSMVSFSREVASMLSIVASILSSTCKLIKP